MLINLYRKQCISFNVLKEAGNGRGDYSGSDFQIGAVYCMLYLKKAVTNEILNIL